MTVRRWPMRLPDDDRIMEVRGTTYEIAARRFKQAWGVEPINAALADAEEREDEERRELIDEQNLKYGGEPPMERGD
jgi:hypothetical protein